ncbi:hypothetical protein LTR53_000951 [Teratosphaeriaceae sp. CCFEE 6253]|nr:hypothetical protein LTR53_000951 [Teratosphaeriaceae sp. CCFEE 6253]
MRILFLCTAHNSLSQRLYLVLSASHDVSIEYALSDEVMISAAALANPDLIICPFLTALVPRQLHEQYFTLIVHPGPPGDAGPSALDWVLLGDDGLIDDSHLALQSLDHDTAHAGRPYWGVTVLQATEKFDAGPVWAFEQFPICIDAAGLTKSELYRGPITGAAITATIEAIARIEDAALSTAHDYAGMMKMYDRRALGVTYSTHVRPRTEYGRLSVTDQTPFRGGILHHRPLLGAAERDFDLSRHIAQQVSRRVRSGDSQPGVLSRVFGRPLFVYGGIIDETTSSFHQRSTHVGRARVLATRSGAVCIATCDNKGLWLTHVRRPISKAAKANSTLFPKVPAISGLLELGLLQSTQVDFLASANDPQWSLSSVPTLQDTWIDFSRDGQANKLAYLYFDFYNGAMSTEQCSRLIEAMDHVVAEHTPADPLRAIVLMGGSYFSNGIALNVIEASDDPAAESWMNINRIDDVVDYLLRVFPDRNILTVAAVRGNAAAGGVALAAACDFVIAGSNVVLNPAYRAVGLHGSEYHTLTYYARCGQATASHLLRSMLPMSALQAQATGVVDFVFPSGHELEDSIRFHVAMLTSNPDIKRGGWKSKCDLSAASLARARALELREFGLDCFSARSSRYHSRRHDFVRKTKSHRTPLRFATHRRQLCGVQYDEEELDSFDDVAHYDALAHRRVADALRSEVRRELSTLVVQWFENESTATAGHITATLPAEPPHTSLPRIVRKTETVFSCYYKPIDAPLTPPESPMCERQAAVFGG